MAGVKRSIGAMLAAEHQLGQHNAFSNGHDTSRPKIMHTALDEVDVITRTPSPSFPPLNGEIPTFSSDASIVLVGIRGSGKSTLAVMAASAMHRRVIDLESAFQRATGMSSASYKKLHGSAQCHRQQAKTLQTILDRHRTDCIIVCSWMETRVQALLREFASSCPVIHVVRDIEAIQDHLKIQDRGKMVNLLAVCRSIFRTCTNFEFFNVSEKPARLSQSSSADSQVKRLPAPHLTLKQAERHILKFLSLIYPPGAIPFNESSFPLAGIPPEQLQFTYALSIPLEDILTSGFDIEEHIAGADVVEIVVGDLSTRTVDPNDDWLIEISSQLTQAVGITRRSSVLPLLLHIVMPETISDHCLRAYLDLAIHVARLAPEMLTVDLRLDSTDISRLVAMKGRAKVIGHYSSESAGTTWESSIWQTVYHKASGLGCDLIRLIKPALSPEDNFAAQRLRFSLEASGFRCLPLILYNSGTLGRHSACFNPILTSVSAKPKTSTDSSMTYQPSLTAPEAIATLASSFIYDPMKLYVFGAKVGYSLSPAMHNSALRACGLAHYYEAHSTRSLSSLKDLIGAPHFGGASIGHPFKVEVISLTHSLSHHARAIGAVNTLIPVRQLNEDGSLPKGGEFMRAIGKAGPVKALYGENTDWVGIRACIRRGLSPANAVKPGHCALVIGAGGMARAAVYAILQVGVQNIVIHNRSTDNAGKMANHFSQLLQKPDFQSLGAGKDTKFHIIDSREDKWPSHVNLPTIIISCIPTHQIGDVPAPDFTVPDPWLRNRSGGVIIELGYKTLDTPLLAQAKREAHRGWYAMDGLDLLPEQGYAQFELFTGRRAPRRVMKRHLLHAFAEHGRSAYEMQSRIMTEVDEDS
jgi:shikimate 5-dehydrogenase/shikimate kinase